MLVAKKDFPRALFRNLSQTLADYTQNTILAWARIRFPAAAEKTEIYRLAQNLNKWDSNPSPGKTRATGGRSVNSESFGNVSREIMSENNRYNGIENSDAGPD